jgi:hypothetical protein
MTPVVAIGAAAGMMKLKNNKYAKDMRPLDENCGCMVCKQYTRSYLYHTIRVQGTAAPAILITYHNVAYMQVRALNLNQQCVAARAGAWGKRDSLRLCKVFTVWLQLPHAICLPTTCVFAAFDLQFNLVLLVPAGVDAAAACCHQGAAAS